MVRPVVWRVADVALDLLRQTVGLGALGTRFFGGVTVYLAQKTTVYRHQTVNLAGRSETTVDAIFEKIELFRRVIAVLRRAEHPLHIPRNQINLQINLRPVTQMLERSHLNRVRNQINRKLTAVIAILH
jgi:hypothetical protein